FCFAFSIPNSAFLSGCKSAADGLAWNEELGSAILSTPTISFTDGWQSSNAPVPKTEWGASPRGCNSFTIREIKLNQKDPMKPSVRYQSQLLFRKSYKPIRVIRIRPSLKRRTFRPSRDLRPNKYQQEC